MLARALGTTGLEVSALGFGAGPLGDGRLSETEADALVNAALDHGITLFDTAPSYGSSEERLGRALGARRRDVVLATKGGYGVPGVPDWTGEVIRRGIDAALTRLRTEVIDIFLLHSCDSATLLRDDILHELTQAKLAGKIQAAGYSGDNEALGAAITSGCFDVVECSVNPFDRTSLLDHVEAAEGSGIGVLAKRSLGNAAWRQTARPDAPDLRTYWDRAQLMNLEVAPDDWSAACVRFAAFAPGIASALVGTSSLAHLQAAVCAVGRGPLESATLTHFDDAWKLHASHWAGVT